MKDKKYIIKQNTMSYAKFENDEIEFLVFALIHLTILNKKQEKMQNKILKKLEILR